MPNFCFRLLFRFGSGIASNAKQVLITPYGYSRPLKLVARTGTLRTSRMLVLSSCGYESGDQARSEGTRLMNAMLVGGIMQRMGVDFGIGVKRVQYSDAVKKSIRDATGEILREEVDGLDVYENGNTTFLVTEGSMTVSGGPEGVTDLIAAPAEIARELTERQRITAELLNDSLFEISSDARFLLRIAAVEALCPQGPARASLVSHIEALKKLIPQSASADDRSVIEGALKERAERQSPRNAYMTKIRQLLDAPRAKEFEKLYNLRSKFLHEGRGRRRLSEVEDRAFKLASDLLLADLRSQTGSKVR